MKKLVEIPFAKLHGCGNDFLVSAAADWDAAARLLCRGLSVGGRDEARAKAALARLAKAICERHTGVGADGFLLALPPSSQENDARVRFFNADGGEAEMSGNGIRCAGAFLMEYAKLKSPLRIETLAGVKTLVAVKRDTRSWVFRVSMGAPILAAAAIPFRARAAVSPVVGHKLSLKQGVFHVTVSSMGNPHCSVFVKDFARIDWPAIGREIERHRSFPNRTNVEFVRVISRREIEVSYWERGVGITASSGTGSCAATVASILNGYTDRSVGVRTVGGKLKVEWARGGEVFLSGPVSWIAEGTYSSGKSEA